MIICLGFNYAKKIQLKKNISRAEASIRIPPLLSENKGVKPIPLLISKEKSSVIL